MIEVKLFLATLAVVTMLAVPVSAQEVSASITGTITDATGALVASASVTAKDVDRGTTYTTTTNEAGAFLFPRITPGRYEVRIEAKGFKTLIRQDIVLEVNQRARMDESLEVGAVTESISVSGEPPLLQT
ncbi:MAG: carboxypeptidase-like regulatory domain-containing protein, partial [Acidobacteriales bacterium]|nr:carboxypeptidase-like regulatory domain-containing protein [Terriglobales bacterium]